MIIKNIELDLIKHESKSYRSRPLDDITHIALHHSGTIGGSAKSFANYHVKTKDWPGIAYHFVINEDGVTYITNKLTTITYNVAGSNDNTVGVCFIGNFDTESISENQIYSGINICANIMNFLGRKLVIDGHRNFPNATTSCPGKGFPLQRIIDGAYEYI